MADHSVAVLERGDDDGHPVVCVHSTGLSSMLKAIRSFATGAVEAA